MSRSRECSFTGEPIEVGTGITFVKKSGEILHFKDSKAESHYKRGVSPQECEWVNNKNKISRSFPYGEHNQMIPNSEIKEELDYYQELMSEYTRREGLGKPVGEETREKVNKIYKGIESGEYEDDVLRHFAETISEEMSKIMIPEDNISDTDYNVHIFVDEILGEFRSHR